VVALSDPDSAPFRGETGYVAACGLHDHHCSWNRLYDSFDEAVTALEAHMQIQRLWSRYSVHYGVTRSMVLHLSDERTARLVAQQKVDRPDYPATMEVLETPDDRTHSEAVVSINAKANGIIELRRTPPGQKTAAGLLDYGDLIETSYGTGPYKVVSVNETRSMNVLPTCSLVLVEPDTEPNADGTFPDTAKSYINELVAQDGEIKELFANNDDRVVKKGKAGNYQARVDMAVWSG
jgi:hypothetical protein